MNYRYLKYIKKLNQELTIQPGLIPILISTFGFGVALGGYLPLISLWLESSQVSFKNIGLVISSTSLGIICSAFLAPRVVNKVGYLNSLLFSLAAAIVLGVLFRYATSLNGWILVRFLGGLGLGIYWVVSEAWLGKIVSDKGRTRALSLYAVSMALGFTIGPGTIWITGYAGKLPFYTIAILELISLIPLMTLKKFQPTPNIARLKTPFLLFKSAPTIAFGCLLVGFVDLTLISLLPALVTRSQTAVNELSLLLPSAIGLGNVLLQYPIASLADRYDKRKVAGVLVITSICLCSIIPFFLENIFIALILTFFGCGLIYCVYTVSLSMLSMRFKNSDLISANASFVIIFELGNLFGPALAGISIDLSLRYGLSIFLVSLGSIYLAVSIIRARSPNYH